MGGSLLRGGTVGAALAVAMTIGLASALAACASSTTTANGSPVGAAGAASSTAVAPVAPIPTTSAPPSSSPSAPASVNPGGPMSTAPPGSPVVPAPMTAPPAKSKYVPIDQETQSADGRTLYLEIEARGGACGQYVVVLQESASDVRVGLAQLQPRVGVMCPMFIGPRTFTVKLSSPVGTRTVIDLATGKRLGS
jgi:hypothetical protein